MRTLLVCIGLTIGVLAVYAPVKNFGFVWDDQVFVSGNPHVAGGFTPENLRWSFGIHGPGQWHPLSFWIHQLNCTLFGLDAGMHHMVNVLPHTAAAMALLGAFRRLTGQFWPSAFVATLFALHPLSVESVAWVAHMRESLSMLFWALAMWAYAGYAESWKSKPNLRFLASGRYWLVVLFFVLGLISKPTLMTLPCVLLLLDFWPLNRVKVIDFRSLVADFRPLILEKLPLFVLAGISVWLTYLCQKSIGEGTVTSLKVFPFGERLANAALSYTLYLRNMVWPTDLAALYPLPKSFNPAWVAAAAILLIAFTIASIRFRRKGYLLVGWLWYLGTLVPVIGIVKTGALTAMADHYTYFSLLGIYLIIGCGLGDLVSARPRLRKIVPVVVCCIMAAMAVKARIQVGVWRDAETLWRNALAHTKNNARAHNNLGNTLKDEGKIDEAIEQFRLALRIEPNYADAHNNLGVALTAQGSIDQAMEQYRLALRINPNNAEAHNNLGKELAAQGKVDEAIKQYRLALRINPNLVLAHSNLGVALVAQGNIDEAIEHFQSALKIYPFNADAHCNLAIALAVQGKNNEAIKEYRTALSINPNHAEACNSLGKALVAEGKNDEAIKQFQSAARINPDYADARNNLGIALASQGRVDEAIEQFQNALRINPVYIDALNNLGVALASQGKIDEAIEQFQSALRINPNHEKSLRSLSTLLSMKRKKGETENQDQVATPDSGQ